MNFCPEVPSATRNFIIIFRLLFLLIVNVSYLISHIQWRHKWRHQKYQLCEVHATYYMVILRPACYYPRDAMLARVIGTATCLSVRPSLTRRYCVKTKKASGMVSSPSGSPKTLVSDAKFHHQILRVNPPNGGLKEGLGVKIQRFSSFKRQYLENGSR